MLPSKERLRRKSVFQRAYNGRRMVSSPQVSLFVLPKESKDNKVNKYWKPMVGFVVSKKTSKSACKRNRVKRQTREAYRLISQEVYSGIREDIQLNIWYAVVFVIHPNALNSSFSQIKSSVESCLIRSQKKLKGKSTDKTWSGKQKAKDDLLVNRSQKSSRTSDNK